MSVALTRKGCAFRGEAYDIHGCCCHLWLLNETNHNPIYYNESCIPSYDRDLLKCLS